MKKSLISLTILLLVSGIEILAQNKLKIYGHKTELTPNPDQDAVEIDAEVAMQSITLKGIIKDMGGIQEIKGKIPLPFIDHDFLKKSVVPLMEKLYNYNYKMAEDQKEAGRAELIKAIEGLSSEKLIELLLDANYLDIRIFGKEIKDRQADIDNGLVILLIDEIQKIIAQKKELETDSTFLNDVLKLPAELKGPICTYLVKSNKQLLLNTLAIILSGHTEKIVSVAITTDGRYAITGSWDNTARLWDLKANPISFQVLQGHTGRINSVAITPDGKYAITGSWDKTARLWDLTETPITSQELRGNIYKSPVAIIPVAITPDGKYALTGSEDRAALLWDLKATPITFRVLRGHSNRIDSAALTPDGKYALTGSYDQTARLWDLNLTNVSIPEIILIKKLQTQKENNSPHAQVFADPIMAIALLDSKHKTEIAQYFGISSEYVQELEEKYPLKKEASEKESKVE